MTDFSTFNWNKLSDVQMGELYAIGDEAVSYPTVSWDDVVGKHYLLLIDENDPNFAYFDSVRVEIKRELVASTNPHLRKTFGDMLGVPKENIMVQNIETVVTMFFHVRGTPDNEIIKVKV